MLEQESDPQRKEVQDPKAGDSKNSEKANEVKEEAPVVQNASEMIPGSKPASEDKMTPKPNSASETGGSEATSVSESEEASHSQPEDKVNGSSEETPEPRDKLASFPVEEALPGSESGTERNPTSEGEGSGVVPELVAVKVEIVSPRSSAASEEEEEEGETTSTEPEDQLRPAPEKAKANGAPRTSIRPARFSRIEAPSPLPASSPWETERPWRPNRGIWRDEKATLDQELDLMRREGKERCLLTRVYTPLESVLTF